MLQGLPTELPTNVPTTSSQSDLLGAVQEVEQRIPNSLKANFVPNKAQK